MLDNEIKGIEALDTELQDVVDSLKADYPYMKDCHILAIAKELLPIFQKIDKLANV